MQTARHWGQATGAEDILCETSVLLECDSESLCALLLRRHQRLGACLANQLLLRRCCASDLEQRNCIRLGDGREPGVAPAHVALPVRVLGDVGGRDSDGVVVGHGVIGTGGWVAELRVQRDTRGALGVEGKQPVDRGINSSRLNSVFLHAHHQRDVSNGGESW